MSGQDCFKDLYFYELSRRESLTGRLSFPTGLLTVLIGAFAVMANKASLAPDASNVALWIGLIGMSAAMIFATFNLILAYSGHEYAYLSHAEALANHHTELANYYTKSGNPEETAKSLASAEFKDGLDKSYAKCSEHNGRLNDQRSYRLFLANQSIVVTVASAFLAFVGYAIVSISTNPPSHMVEITNIKELAMSMHLPDPPQTSEPTSDPQTLPPVTPSIPEKPGFPPERYVKEDIAPDHLPSGETTHNR